MKLLDRLISVSEFDLRCDDIELMDVLDLSLQKGIITKLQYLEIITRINKIME